MSDNTHMLNSRSVENIVGSLSRLGIHSSATSTSSLRTGILGRSEMLEYLGPGGFKDPTNGDHSNKLAEDVGNLFMNDTISDVTFRVDGCLFPAHKVIMAARSDYFRAMLFGGLRESTEKEIELHDTPVDAFRLLLRYTYTGKISLAQMKESLVIEVLGLAHQYGFIDLEKVISDYLRSTVDIQNVCTILAAANLYSRSDLLSYCFDFADMRAEEVLKTDAFRRLPPDAIELLLQRDSFCAPEIKIFEAIRDWINEHGDESDTYPRIVALLRMPLIELKDLLHTIRPSKFFSADAILDAIQEQAEKNSSELVYRGFLWPNTNVATTSHAMIAEGESEAAIQEGYSHTNQQDDKMTRHVISDTDPGIVIKFNRPFILNNIRLMLFDRDQRVFCSYYVEVGMDQNHLVRVIDRTHYICRSKQNLFFTQRVVKYIRIVGTYCSNSTYFSVAHVEAQYTTEPFTVDPATTLLIPTSNVATIQNNALVVEGVSRLRNCLINGETNTYDWDNGYTCHQVGSGAIAVQLPQAYLIDSLRLLLWDCDDRYYQYYVEVSVDQKNWVRVADKTQEQCRAWQLIRFERRPVVFIRIVGTHNSANEVFHCVHFECPAQRRTKYSRYMSIETENVTDVSSLSVDDSSASSGSAEHLGRHRHDLWVYLRRNWGLFPLLILCILALAVCSALFCPNVIVKVTVGSLGWAFACLMIGVMMQIRSQPLAYYVERAKAADDQRRKARMFNNFTSMNAPSLEQRQRNQMALIRSTTMVGAHHAAATQNLIDCQAMYTAVGDAALLGMRRSASSRN